MFTSEFVCFPTERHPSCHCSSVVELPNGELLCCWYAGEGEARPDVQILTARKRVGSFAWDEPVVAVDDDPTKPMGNCVLWVDRRGRVWLFYGVMHGKLDGHWGPGVRWDTVDSRYRISEDGGHTWGPMVMMRKEWHLVFRTKPLVHSSGRILIGVEHSREASHFWLSDDEGKTWRLNEKPVAGPENLHPTMIERSDGSILAMLRAEEDHLIPYTVSKDRGETWRKAVNTKLPSPHAAIDMVKLADGRVALAFNNSPRHRSPLTIALSMDEGRTWPIMRDVESSDRGELSYPALIQGRDGLLHLTYTWRRGHIRHAAFDTDWIERK